MQSYQRAVLGGCPSALARARQALRDCEARADALADLAFPLAMPPPASPLPPPAAPRPPRPRGEGTLAGVARAQAQALRREYQALGIPLEELEERESLAYFAAAELTRAQLTEEAIRDVARDPARSVPEIRAYFIAVRDAKPLSAKEKRALLKQRLAGEVTEADYARALDVNLVRRKAEIEADLQAKLAKIAKRRGRRKGPRPAVVF